MDTLIDRFWTHEKEKGTLQRSCGRPQTYSGRQAGMCVCVCVCVCVCGRVVAYCPFGYGRVSSVSFKCALCSSYNVFRKGFNPSVAFAENSFSFFKCSNTSSSLRSSDRSQNHGSSRPMAGVIGVCPSPALVSPSTAPKSTVCGRCSAIGPNAVSRAGTTPESPAAYPRA